MPAGLLTAAERSMIENHKRVNETGQAMNEATAPISLFPLSPGMNCFIMIKDKTGVNDTFTFPPVKGKLDSIWMKAAADACFTPAAAAGEDGRLRIDEAGDVCLDAGWKMSPLVSPR